MYTDEDFVRLLQVSRFVKEGNRISKVANWSEEELAMRQETQRLEAGLKPEVDGYFHDEIIKAAVQFDEHLLERVYARVSEQIDFESMWLELFVPVLQRVGYLWIAKKVSAAQEHFMSAWIRRKVNLLIDQLPLPDEKSPKIILFLPPNEYHDLGLLLCQYVVRKAGFSTVFLGQNVPVECLKNVSKRLNPIAFVTFGEYTKISRKFEKVLRTWDTTFGLDLLYGGVIHRDDLLMIKNVQKIHPIGSIQDLKSYLAGKQ